MFMHFVDANGKEWFLHKKKCVIGYNKIKVDTWYFSRTKNEKYLYKGELPLKYQIITLKNGLPALKKR